MIQHTGGHMPVAMEEYRKNSLFREKANEVGYETNLECDRKFRDFWFSGIALQRLSDIICLEHGLSIIPKVKPSKRQRRTKYPERTSVRDVIRDDILKCLV